MSDALASFLGSVANLPLLSREQEIELSRKYQAGSRAAKDSLIRHNLKLVANVAKKYHDSGIEFEDLLQVGTLGLTRAVEKFDATKGYKLSTYAYWWIRQAITREIGDRTSTI